jgi:hypothetical protein
MAVRADPEAVRAVAAALRTARLTIERCAGRVESSVVRVHAESWRGDRADEVLGEVLAGMERLRGAAEAMAALTARVERYALALDAYLLEGDARTVLSGPVSTTTVEFSRGALGGPTGRWEHHRAVAALAKHGVEFYAIDLSLELDSGLKGSAEVALVDHVSSWRERGAWRIRHGATLGAIGITGEVSTKGGRPGGDVGVDAVIAEKRVEIERSIGSRIARAEVRAGLAFHLGVGVSSDAVAVRLPFLSVEFSLRRAEVRP